MNSSGLRLVYTIKGFKCSPKLAVIVFEGFGEFSPAFLFELAYDGVDFGIDSGYIGRLWIGLASEVSTIDKRADFGR